jgi:sugar phosphate isomerase/epimerase
MATKNVDLLAAYWTLAGDVYPCAPDEVSPYPLRDRAVAASKAGWKGLGLVLVDLEATIKKEGVAGVRSILNDNGMKHFELEILVDWYADGERRKNSDIFRKSVIELGAALGMKNLKIGVSHLEENLPPLQKLVDEFGRLCQDVAQVGATVSLEFMPFSPVRNIADGLAIVQGADQPNGGLTVDNWHVCRAGDTYEDVAKIPSKYIKSVELDDAVEKVVGTMFDDTRFSRRLCGEGVFEPRKFVQAIQTAGFDGPYYGVELISESFRKLPLDVMAKRAFDTTLAQF